MSINAIKTMNDIFRIYIYIYIYIYIERERDIQIFLSNEFFPTECRIRKVYRSTKYIQKSTAFIVEA